MYIALAHVLRYLGSNSSLGHCPHTIHTMPSIVYIHIYVDYPNPIVCMYRYTALLVHIGTGVAQCLRDESVLQIRIRMDPDLYIEDRNIKQTRRLRSSEMP